MPETEFIFQEVKFRILKGLDYKIRQFQRSSLIICCENYESSLKIFKKFNLTHYYWYMNLLLSLTIGSPIPASYQNNIVETLKIRCSDLIVYDCDNHSEGLVIKYAIDLLEQSINAAIVIRISEADSAQKLGSLRLLLERILHHPEKSRVFITGIHLLADRLLQVLPSEQVHRNLSEKKQIEDIEAFLYN